MSDVTLTAAVRDSLLSLQNTTTLIATTQNRMSTGLKVAGPVDDPVAYFQAKSLNDRASDFSERKKNIDQGVSTVSSALDGVKSIEALVKQLKGIANSMKSADSSQMSDLLQQFNDLRDQINTVGNDSTYQGTNLISGAGQKLTVEFSEKTASRVVVNSVDLTNGSAGLAMYEAKAYTGGFYANYAAADATSGGNVTATNLLLTWEGAQATYSAGSTVSFSYGTGSMTLNIADTQTFATRDTLTVAMGVQSAQSTGIYTTGATTLNFAVDSNGRGTNQALYAQYSVGTGSVATTAISANSAGTVAITLTWNGPTSTFTGGTTVGFTTASFSGFNALSFEVMTGNGNSQVVLTRGSTITISVFSNAATMSANSIDLGLNLGTSGVEFISAGNAASVVDKVSAGAAALTLSWEGLASTFASGSSLTFAYGTSTLTMNFNSQTIYSQAASVTVHLVSQNNDAANMVGSYVVIGTGGLANGGAFTNTFQNATHAGTTAVSANVVKANYVNAGDTEAINAVISALDSALTTIRTKAQGLGTNVALLQARLDFTTTYVNELQKGGAKLTVADINEEGANLLALQTRQQLGTNALRFAGQADQAVLSLFR